MFMLGLTGAIGNVEFGTYLVRNVADDMIAKVSGIGQMLAIGACALGPVLGGFAIQQFQIQGAVCFFLGIMISLALASLFMPEAPPQVSRIFRAIKHAIASPPPALNANSGAFTLKPVRSSGACLEQNRAGRHEAVMPSGTVPLWVENSRPVSSVRKGALTCRDARH